MGAKGHRAALVAALALVCAAALGCGRVLFVPSPWTPQSITITYAPSEDLSVVRWAIAGSADGVRFELAQPDGSFGAIDFAAAPYSSGTYPCDAGTCAQLVLRGHYRAPAQGPPPVRARKPGFGVSPGTPAAAERTVDPSLAVTLAFADDNAQVRIAVDDRLLAGPLPRRFIEQLWPEPDPAGACAHPAGPEAPLPSASAALPAPAPLDDAGRYCVAVRGAPQDGGPSLRVQAAALTWPQTVRAELDYKPPVESTPLLYQLILDLETAEPTRCTAVHDALLRTLRGALAAADPRNHEFALIDLAPRCQQDPTRSFDPAQVADQIKQYVHQNVAVVQNRPLLFYANNLNVEVPGPLLAALSQLPQDFANDNRFSTFYWGMVAPGATPGIAYDAPTSWTAIEDPGFARLITQLVEATLPFQTQLHDNAVMVPLLDPAELSREQGGLLKLCQSTPPVTLAAGGVVATGLFVAVTTAAPPGFFVDLPVKITVPRAEFSQDDVLVRYEICSRFCDHSFTNDAGLFLANWKMVNECVHNHVP